MRKIIATLTIALTMITAATAQEHRGPGERRHFSPEEFKTKQKEYKKENMSLSDKIFAYSSFFNCLNQSLPLHSCL